MRFVKAVQNKEVAWPTQAKFDTDKWRQAAADLCEDEADWVLAQTGLWCAEALAPLRKEFVALGLWSLSQAERAELFIGAANHVFYSVSYLSSLRAETEIDSSEEIWVSGIPERIMEEVELPRYGSAKATDLVETAVDDAERCMKHSQSRTSPGVMIDDALSESGRAMSLVGAYQSIEFIFHRSLWLDWRFHEMDDYWLFSPSDVDTEKRWEASLRRFDSLGIQATIQLQQAFTENEAIRIAWLHNSGPLPHFTIREENEWMTVEHAGSTVPAKLPWRLLSQVSAQEFYYTPLLNEPLSILSGKTVNDLLGILNILGAIAEKVIEVFPADDQVFGITELHKFSPIFSHKHLLDAITSATTWSSKEINRFLKVLTWNEHRSLWFHPLVRITTKKGPAYLFTLLPLISPHLYRVIDYWLSEFGLPIEKRGALFEEEVAEGIQDAAYRGGVSESVQVARPGTLLAVDGQTEQEIDVLLLLHNLIVVGEVKCQAWPDTPTDRYNYIKTLEDGSHQASAKANWAEENLDIIARTIGVSAAQLSGEVLPIVITNHPLGAGSAFNNVPVLDLRLFRNYLGQPYVDTRQIGKAVNATCSELERFYNSPTEMADHFRSYATNPPFLSEYLTRLEPHFTYFPIHQEKPVMMLQFVSSV